MPSRVSIAKTPFSGPAPDRSRKPVPAAASPEQSPLPVNSGWSFGDVGVLGGILQRKLQVGAADDPMEREADAIAERVTGGDRLQRKCDACKEEAEADKISRKAWGGETTAPVNAPPIVHEVLRQPGTPLDSATRSWFEPRFGRDFSSVRVHSGAAAAQSARSVNARAFTVGRNLVFAEGQFDPASDSGRKLLAHELVHTLQQSTQAPAVQRKPGDDTIDVDLVAVSPEEAERLRKQGIDLPKVSEETYKKLEPAPQQQQLAPATPPSGFVSAAAGAAPCPAAPDATVIPENCPVPAPVTGSAPPKNESADLPALNESDFGGDSKVETFAGALADCHAARIVQAEVDKRFKAAVESAKKSATAEAKADTAQALSDAVVGIDPKDKKALAAARKQASATAKTAADKKIADAQAAVQKQDPAVVQAELSAAFKDELKTDYLDTMHAALRRFGPGWVNGMKAAQTRARARLTKEKNAKPKVKKGETPPPQPAPEEIAAQIEAEMIPIRCHQQNWAANQIEKVKRGWMVGRREKVDFDTIAQHVAELKDFNPGRTVDDADRVPIPAGVQAEPNDPGVAPEVAQFLTVLQSLQPNFTAGNYAGHGGGSWAGAGFSVDLNLSGKDAELDSRGFYKPEKAVQFLLNLDKAATSLGGKWRVLYNDFSVAEEVNHVTGTRNVTYMGNNPKGTLNWHGPAPMVLHFHLDIQLPPPAATPASPTPASPTPETPSPEPPSGK